MNKLKWILLLAVFAVLALSSCFIDIDDDDDFDCINAGGPFITTELFLADFNGIELELPARVVIQQGPLQQVVVQGSEAIINELELDIRNGIWEIETNRCINNLGDLTFIITVPAIRALHVVGSGDIVSEEFLEVGNITLSIIGSGNIDLGLNADVVDADITGSGNIFLEGATNDLDINISGSGSIGAFDLQSDDVFVRIAGSGDVKVAAFSKLTVRISGSGDVRYIGDPALDIEINGSGDVIDVG
ncbi:MAG: head GIN domain-containing protein [Bacteroidota bacterium]